VSRTISLALTPEAQVGDYVIVHTGFAISVLDEQEAQETLKLFDELAAFERATSSTDEANVPDTEAAVLDRRDEA